MSFMVVAAFPLMYVNVRKSEAVGIRKVESGRKFIVELQQRDEILP